MLITERGGKAAVECGGFDPEAGLSEGYGHESVLTCQGYFFFTEIPFRTYHHYKVFRTRHRFSDVGFFSFVAMCHELCRFGTSAFFNEVLETRCFVDSHELRLQ